MGGDKLSFIKKSVAPPEVKEGQVLTAKIVGMEYPVESVKDVLEGIKKHGSVYVKCRGFREYNEQLYPKFKVVANKLPSSQKTVETPKKTVPKPSEMDLERLTPEQRKKLESWLNQ